MSMKVADFVTCLLDASGGSIQGKTLIQKRAFFICQDPGIHVSIEFIAHYYGPFSPALDMALGRLKSLGFVDERATGFGVAGSLGFEMKRYDYRLTDDGKEIAESIKRRKPEMYQRIQEGLDRIKNAGDPDYVELSIAAKALFILKSKGKAMTHDEVLRAAQSFDWKISGASLERAVSFLQTLGFVETTRRQAN